MHPFASWLVLQYQQIRCCYLFLHLDRIFVSKVTIIFRGIYFQSDATLSVCQAIFSPFIAILFRAGSRTSANRASSLLATCSSSYKKKVSLNNEFAIAPQGAIAWSLTLSYGRQSDFGSSRSLKLAASNWTSSRDFT